MAKFGTHSKKERATLHVDLQAVFDAAIERTDFTILQGNRNKVDQEAAFEAGHSRLRWPGSKHNQSEGDFDKSDAGDIMPYPIEWPDKRNDHPLEYIRKMMRIFELQRIIFEEAERLGVQLKWGGMFQSLFDAPHVERIPNG